MAKETQKVLVVLTNTTQYGQTTDPTGLWLGEATEFVAPLQAAGIHVDYVSPKGGFVPLDPRSMKYTNPEIMKVYNDPDFQQRALTHSLAAKDVSPADYAAIYFTGGHGVMWDFPDNPDLQRLSLAIYHQGGYLTSVCHGIVGLINLKDDDGQYLIANKKITGFTNMEERLSGKRKVVPFLSEQAAKQHGANFQKVRAYGSFAVQDGQLITGQNPFSPAAVAKLLLQNLSK